MGDQAKRETFSCKHFIFHDTLLAININIKYAILCSGPQGKICYNHPIYHNTDVA